MPMFYSAILLTGVNLLLRLVSTSFQVYISGRLGAAGVGLLQLVLSVGMLAMTAGMAGVRTATMYLTAEELGKKRPGNVKWVLRGCFLYSIVCSGAIAFGVFAAAPMIAEHWVGDIRTIESIRTFAVFLPVVCLSGCMTGYFTAENRITTLAGVEIAEQLCAMGVTMTALTFWAGNDPGKACQSVILGSSISACLTLSSLILLSAKETYTPTAKIPVRSRLLNTALPLALADDLKAGINTTENLMVPKRLGFFPGTESPLAAFGMVCGMVFPILMFPAAILFALAELLIPELARCNAAQSRQRINYLVRRSLRIAMLYGCLCGGLLFLLAEPLCAALYQDFQTGRYLRLYAFLAPMLYCDAITDAMTKGLGQQNICVRYNILTSALDVIFLYLLLPRYGMIGYFISFFVTHLLNFCLSLRLLLKITKLKIPFYIPALTLSATLAAALGASFLQNIPMQIGAYLALLLSLLTLFRVISKDDILWLKGLLIQK
jgi:stage V sporulation protein B